MDCFLVNASAAGAQLGVNSTILKGTLMLLPSRACCNAERLAAQVTLEECQRRNALARGLWLADFHSLAGSLQCAANCCNLKLMKRDIHSQLDTSYIPLQELSPSRECGDY